MGKPDLMEEAPHATDHPPHIHEAARTAYSEALRDGDSTAIADAIAAAEQRGREELLTPRPADEYHEDMGNVLWWHYPIQEPPYVGTTLDEDFDPDWHQWWTPLPDPSGNVMQEAIAAAIRRGTP